jgi:biopolymer transport protein ExbD
MARRRRKAEEKAGVPIAPMIDVVFLLLIYFMVSSTLERQEADLSFQLPGTVEQEEALDLPDEQVIELHPDGRVVVNEYAYDSPAAIRLVELAAMLTRFREASAANKVEAVVTIAPAPEVPHGRIVRVMDACAAAGIKAVNFALE